MVTKVTTTNESYYVLDHGDRHGEYKFMWYEYPISHCFYVNGVETPLTEIPYPTTPAERTWFTLKYDLQLLPVEKNVC